MVSYYFSFVYPLLFEIIACSSTRPDLMHIIEFGKETHINVSVIDEVRKQTDKPIGSAVFEIGDILGSRVRSLKWRRF